MSDPGQGTGAFPALAADSLIHARRTLTAPGRRTVSAQELLARLVDELPAPERVEPFAFLEDELLPQTLAPVEPTAFILACVQAAWGPHGPKN